MYDTDYALHVATGNGKSVTVSNSFIKGWSSFGGEYKSLSFENVDFGRGGLQETAESPLFGAAIRLYDSASFSSCAFRDDFKIDVHSSVPADTVITLTDCKIVLSGDTEVSVTSANITQLLNDADDAKYFNIR